MIRHIVLVRFKPGIDETAVDALFAEIGAVKPHVPGMINVASGRSLELE